MFVQIQQVCGRSMLPIQQGEVKIKCLTRRPIFPLVKGGYFINLISLWRDMDGNDLRGKIKRQAKKSRGDQT